MNEVLSFLFPTELQVGVSIAIISLAALFIVLGRLQTGNIQRLVKEARVEAKQQKRQPTSPRPYSHDNPVLAQKRRAAVHKVVSRLHRKNEKSNV